MMPTTLYQPVALGTNWLDLHTRRYSQIIYSTREDAERGLPSFIKRATERRGDYDLGRIELEETAIIESILEDE